MSKFRDTLIRGFRSNIAYKGFDDEHIIENLKICNICPSMLGLDGGFSPNHCASECDECWSNVHTYYN